MYILCITSAFSMFRGMNVLFACYIAFLLQLLVFQTCHSSNITAHCAPSSCGNIRNISYPFRLDTDPQSCGNNNYTLICENNISTVLYLYSGKYYVQAIDYGNFTIRVVDAGVQDNCCSIPRYSLAPDNFSDGDPYTWYNYKQVPLPGASEGFVDYWGHRYLLGIPASHAWTGSVLIVVHWRLSTLTQYFTCFDKSPISTREVHFIRDRERIE